MVSENHSKHLTNLVNMFAALDSPLKYIMSTDECYTGSGTCGTVNTWCKYFFPLSLELLLGSS